MQFWCQVWNPMLFFKCGQTSLLTGQSGLSGSVCLSRPDLVDRKENARQTASGNFSKLSRHLHKLYPNFKVFAYLFYSTQQRKHPQTNKLKKYIKRAFNIFPYKVNCTQMAVDCTDRQLFFLYTTILNFSIHNQQLLCNI